MSGIERAAVFLDRDGTLIKDTGYLADPAEVELTAGAGEALSALRDAGFRLALVSNQSGIGRGYFTWEEAEAVHARFAAELARHGIGLDDVRYCPHLPDAGCSCRKPAPGALIDSADSLDVDLAESFMVGDSITDVQAGRAAGCRTVVVGDDREAGRAADLYAPDWAGVVEWITAEATRPR